jgi:transcriptional antiterminator RfaH
LHNKVKLTESKAWYITYTRARAEKQIAVQLEKACVAYFLPLHKELRQWSDRKKWVEIPMFPSYIFVQVNQLEYYEILGIPGMLRYVTIRGEAVRLSDARMQDIKRAVESNKVLEVIAGAPAPGDIITLRSGVLKGMTGTVIRLEGKHHLLLAIEELGKYLKIKIQPDEL